MPNAHLTGEALCPGIETLESFRSYVRGAWRAETSIAPNDWCVSNPAVGQCAVTALVFQDLFGGELLRGRILGGTHYWNRLPSGQEIDLTAEQFEFGPVVSDIELCSRAYVLSYPATNSRYRRLLAILGLQP